MEIVRALVGVDVKDWLECCRKDGVPMYWFGTGAEALGLMGAAKSSTALRLLRYWMTPDGEQLVDAPGLTAAYWVRFRPDSTVQGLAIDSEEAREAVLAAHRVAVKAALEVLEEVARRGLAGVEAARDVMINEIVFVANGRYLNGSGWRPLDTPRAVFNIVRPAARAALAAYQRRLGEELAQRLGVEVAYEDSPETGLPIVVVKS